MRDTRIPGTHYLFLDKPRGRRGNEACTQWNQEMIIMKRCEWANRSELEQSYHDHEWGVAIHDDRRLFEFLVLEGAQAGLSWSTILRKREGYRKALDNFDVQKISRYSENEVSRLLVNSDIIRNKLKISAAITNARAFLRVRQEFGSFNRYIWQFVKGRPIQNSWEKMADIPSSTPESEAMSKDLQKRGFKFVGSTICYAFMQAVGMVNDHLVSCFRYEELKNKDRLSQRVHRIAGKPGSR
jgi:DNA-3-methyladenine glycosylase I